MLLKLAYEFQKKLKGDPNLSQADLACEFGVSRARITQIMNLLRLAPNIQGYILKMAPVKGGNGLVERHLRLLCRIRDTKVQQAVFGHLRERSFRRPKGAVSTPSNEPGDASFDALRAIRHSGEAA